MIETTEMRMLRWMLGIRRVEKSRKEDIRVRARVINVRVKMRETRLRGLGHIERKEKEAAMKRAWTLKVPGKRPRGTPKLRWKDVVT